ncbi:protrudin isoform X2 [Denticeps clupeoides]|uniref:protrudin isoform X2 n=1 Tax=Denticeps clupeoides TaxID=299321 RepID=UPI0010A48086|nr:protrudin isoform X2 [Denticeps clupeoides]
MHPAAQELQQGHGDITRLPDKDLAATNLARARPPTFDLLKMVVSYKRMAIYLEPVWDIVEVVRYLLGWRTPVFSLFCCVTLNILLLTLSEVAWFSLCLFAVSAPAVLGYFGDWCLSRDSETPLQRFHAVQRKDLQTVHLTKQEAMLEVKGLLKQLDDLLTQMCVWIESVYKMMYWESHSASSLFYGCLLSAVCLLYMAPVGWVLATLNSTLFLWNKDFCRVVYELKGRFSVRRAVEGASESPESETTRQLEQTPTPTSVEDLSPGSVEEAEEAEPDDEFRDAIESSVLTVPLPQEPSLALPPDDEDVSTSTPDYDSISDNGLLSRNEPIRSRVSKLTEKLRKRVPSNPTGNCSTCGSVFNVLKKRRNCSNCGNSFCSRCCSYKVLKSSMGATAPEAQRETVFVCAACNAYLCKKD